MNIISLVLLLLKIINFIMEKVERDKLRGEGMQQAVDRINQKVQHVDDIKKRVASMSDDELDRLLADRREQQLRDRLNDQQLNLLNRSFENTVTRRTNQDDPYGT